MERISKYQLGSMIILFQIGSTPLFELGIKANQDAWLVVVTSMLLGLMLLFLFLAIQRREPEKNLSQLLTQYFGSFVGKFLLLLYVRVLCLRSHAKCARFRGSFPLYHSSAWPHFRYYDDYDIVVDLFGLQRN